MRDQSSYLRYLPPVLWRDDDPSTGLSLGGWLRIIEKILTGIDDDVTVPHGEHVHPSIAEVVDGLDEMFQPWRTPSQFLPWLASWVTLDFPTLQDKPLWDEYQQRRVLSEIARIYRQRGLRAGMKTYLDLYAVGAARPRVAIDDGSRLLSVTPRADNVAPVGVLVGQGPAINGQVIAAEGLIRPWAVDVGSNGDLFVADISVPKTVGLALPNRVWQLSSDGTYRFTGAPPKPRPVAPNLQLNQVVAIAARPARGNRPETLYILDRAGRLSAVPAPFDAPDATTVSSLAPGGNTAFRPVAMAVDRNGDLLVLDRGDDQDPANPPKIITVAPDPLAVTRRNLAAVTEPLSFLVEADGSILVGDGRQQIDPAADQMAGNLVVIDRSDPDHWAESLLLPARNPLVAPTGLARTDDGVLYVLDAGVKPFSPGSDPFVLEVAEGASVFQVDRDTTAVVRISDQGQMVYPTGMAATGDRLVICDPGQPEVAGVAPYWSRLQPFRFDVVVHFAEDRLPADADERGVVLAQVASDVRRIVDENRPAHTVWSPISQF